MKFFFHAVFSILIALTSGILQANATESSHSAPDARADNAFLSQSDAKKRTERISNIAYELTVTLTGKEDFSGISKISFELSDIDSAMTIDLDNANITELIINNKPTAILYNKWFITLPRESLIKGGNTVTVSYTRPHNNDGNGLHRMLDPVDGEVYIYSNFEPDTAHHMFALFDQPDLKASYQITAIVPAPWQVVSTMRETSIDDLGETRRWNFPATKQLSSYVFSLHAGPYKMWQDTTGKYPLRLFSRQSVAALIVPADWFNYTTKGLAFFEDYFGIPYQFEKYDQLLVPDLNAGAMENVAAVTFNERDFLHKSAMSEAQHEQLAGVIMHEMAHQWFGNMVTMKWWNGLWLNESFASFLGTMATAEATKFPHVWQSFFSENKQSAYTLDQQSLTHPIDTEVASTANANDNFDAITYDKGASALKQLRHLLGEEVFREGVHNYLSKYAYKNATQEDFIDSLSKTANRDLQRWTRQWIYSAGVNTISAKYTCKKGKIKAFALYQNPAGIALPELREQRVQIALFKLNKQGLESNKVVAVIYQGAITPLPELIDAPCPDLAFPNYEDWAYVKVKLDKQSFSTATKHLSQVHDPLLRAMLWQNFWDGVTDGDFPLNELFNIVFQHAPTEKDYTLLTQILNQSMTALDALNLMAPGAIYTVRTALDLEQMTWAGTQANKGESSLLRRWFDAYISTARSKAALENLRLFLEGKLSFVLMPIDQDLRWKIITQLNRLNYPGSLELITAESILDNSDRGQASAIGATVVRPDTAIKAQWLETIFDLKTKLPLSSIQVAMENIYPNEQLALSETSANERLTKLAQLDKIAGTVYMTHYLANMIPASCSAASNQRLKAAIAQFTELSDASKRALVSKFEDDVRCVSIKQSMTIPMF